jgi:ApaG protein
LSSSETITKGIRVSVRAQYLPERSQPAEGAWAFAYRVRITNERPDTVQLLSRHWVITDAHGSAEEVRGPGVVGAQPILAPGESFEYTSGCPLRTPFGTMHGTYQMATPEGERFDAEIAPFALTEPHSIN